MEVSQMTTGLIGGLDLAVLPVESITLQPLHPSEDTSPSPSLADIEVVIHDDPHLLATWFPLASQTY
jgi:hypothetical protein